MTFNLNIPAIIKALTRFVQVLDQHRFGAVMLVVVMIIAGVLIVAACMPTALQQLGPPMVARQAVGVGLR